MSDLPELDADGTIARIAAIIDTRRAAAIAFLRELISAGRDGEDGVQARVAARATAIGCTVQATRYEPGAIPMRHEFADQASMRPGERTAIVARYAGQGGGRSLIFFAHPDSETVTTPHGWTHDPFAGIVEHGRIHGWGVADDLAGVACMVEALDAVLAGEFFLRGDVTLASTPSKRHARGVCALLLAGLGADAAVYLHPAESGTAMREIKTFASGQVEFKIIIEGSPPPTTEPLQTAFAHMAVSPIEKAFLVHAALRALDERRALTSHHPALDDAVGRSTNLMLSHIASGDPARLSQLARSCVLGGALAFPPPETLEEVQEQLVAALHDAAAKDSWLAQHPRRIVWRSGVTGAELSIGHALYSVAAAAVQSVTGAAPAMNALHRA